MYQNRKISLIIPCFNEEEGIEKILGHRPSFIDELIVIDNNSTDRTSVVAKKLGARVIPEKQKGYGQCYLTGFKTASGDILVTMDGDNSYPVKEIRKLIDVLIKKELDFVSGCRFPLKNKQAMAVLNKWGNYLLTLVFIVLILKKIRDSQSGMWVFKRTILARMNLKSKGMPLSEEIKMEAVLNKGVKFKEVPISYAERAGRVKLRKFRDGLINLFFLFKKRIELMFK